MEILERGRLASDYTYLGRCRGCSSKVRAKHEELVHSSSQLDGDLHYERCPVCKTTNIYFEREVA